MKHLGTCISLLLLLVTVIHAPAAESQCAAAPPPDQCWTTGHVIQSPIDHHAQSALLRMFTRGGDPAADASAILYAARCGQLDGVYLPDQGVPAQRAQAAGSGWWQMIPQGRPATCYRQPAGSAPIIVFRKQIKDQPDALASALGSAWRECGLTASLPRCYTATISKPDTDGGGSERLIIDLVSLGGGQFPYEAKVSVVDMTDQQGDGGLKTGRGRVEFMLAANESYVVIAQSLPPAPPHDEWSCQVGPSQQFKMEPGVTLQITLKVPPCIQKSGGV